MKNLWNKKDAALCKDLLDLRVYSSRLLGRESDLVLHGGGNTSVKITDTTPFGEKIDTLYVKGSGWDLATIERAGFSPVSMDVLHKMAALKSLSDSDMVKYQRAAMSDPFAPNPSVEAIMHAILPFRFVDHTHADAVVTLTNNPAGKKIIEEVYGDTVYMVPYIMPGFVLAQEIYRLLNNKDIHKVKGLILMNHGIFSFHDEAQISYTNMINMVTQAERYIAGKKAVTLARGKAGKDLLTLSQIRKQVAGLRGKAVLAQWNQSPEAAGFSNLKNVSALISQGPLTPDHSIRIKRVPAVLGQKPLDDIENYGAAYAKYFKKHQTPGLTCLDLAPRWAVWQGYGTLSFGAGLSESGIISDITDHTLRCMQMGEKLGGWKALGEKDIFEVEYWELEQAKLKKAPSAKAFTGKVALITGAASGIGLACARHLHAQGCMVVGLDINPAITKVFDKPGLLPIRCDVTQPKKLKAAVEKTVETFGGLDYVILNAGIFSAGQTIENLDSKLWAKSLDINLTSAQNLLTYAIPYLKNGLDASVLIVGSRNVAAPGAGAAAYSAAKAGLTQLGRVAALELAPHGVRVNSIHPDAVFDTGLWTPEALKRSAQRYGMSVEEYKQRNLMKTEITSDDVAELVTTMLGKAFAKTTGAQVPIDGGNDRVV